MARNVLDDLPADLAFVAPAVRAMLGVRAGFKPSVDHHRFPEQAEREELDQCGTQYRQFLYESLKKRFSEESGAAFNRQVIAFGDSLWKWLTAYRGDRDTPEMALLFTIVGMIPPVKGKTWFQRAGSALGAAYAQGRFTRPRRQ